MLRRLSGLLLIIRGLAPFLVVIVIAVTGRILIGDVEAAVQEPIRAIETEFNNIKAVVETIKTDIDDVKQKATAVVGQVQSFISGVTGTINNVTQQIRTLLNPINAAISAAKSAVGAIQSALQTFINAANSVVQVINVGCPTLHKCINLPTIPNLNLPNLVPDIQPLVNAIETALSPLKGIFDDFAPAIQSIQALSTTLQSLPGKFNNILDDGGQILNGLRGVVARWGNTFLVALIILAALTLIYFAVPLVDNVARGWRLLRGLPAE